MAPTPQMARPTMKEFMLGATSQIADPASMMTMEPMNNALMLQKPYSLPPEILSAKTEYATSLPAHHCRQVPVAETAKATDIHGKVSIWPKSLTTAGWMSATMVVSSAKRKVVMRTATATRNQAKPETRLGISSSGWFSPGSRALASTSVRSAASDCRRSNHLSYNALDVCRMRNDECAYRLTLTSRRLRIWRLN